MHAHTYSQAIAYNIHICSHAPLHTPSREALAFSALERPEDGSLDNNRPSILGMMLGLEPSAQGLCLSDRRENWSHWGSLSSRKYRAAVSSLSAPPYPREPISTELREWGWHRCPQPERERPKHGGQPVARPRRLSTHQLPGHFLPALARRKTLFTEMNCVSAKACLTEPYQVGTPRSFSSQEVWSGGRLCQGPSQGIGETTNAPATCRLSLPAGSVQAISFPWAEVGTQRTYE